jgi:DNA polymerase-3 subunit delta
MSAWGAKLAGGQAPVYLLHGEETLLTREAMQWLRQAVLQGIAEDFNLDRFDGRDAFDPERVAQAARTLPMMAQKRLVWVRNAEVVFSRKKDALRPLLDYLDNPDPSSCLVFEAMVAVKKNAVLYRKVASVGCVHASRTPSERELPSWIGERVRARGRTMEAGAAALLADAIGRDLSGLDTAIERLTLFVEGDALITSAHVDETVVASRTRTVWELVDAVADRNVSVALERAHLLLDQGEQALYLLAMVVRQFRQLLIGHGARADGAGPDEAAKRAGLPPFRARRFAQQLRNYSTDDLMLALERLSAADRALKSSKLPSAVVFEAALVDLCAPRG